MLSLYLIGQKLDGQNVDKNDTCVHHFVRSYFSSFTINPDQLRADKVVIRVVAIVSRVVAMVTHVVVIVTRVVAIASDF